MKIDSLKTKMLLLVLVSIFVSFSILGFYNASNNYNAEYNLIKQKELDLAKETSKFINSYLKSKIDIIEAVKEVLPANNLDVNNKTIAEKLLLGNKAGNFVDFYIGFEKDGSFLLSDGSYLDIEKDNFDARTRPWYKDAVSLNKSGVSNPYVDITTKKLVVTVFTPFVYEGKLLGVIGSDIFLDTVVDSILNVSIDGMGFAYLLDSSGKTIIHKDKKILDKQNNIYKQLEKNKKLYFAEASNKGKDKLIAYSNIPLVDWKLVVELDKEIAFEKIKNNTIKEIIFYIVLLIFILGIMFFFLSKILSPIKTLENGLKYFFKYLKGEESNISKLTINTNDEFERMALMIDDEMETIAKGLENDKELIDNVKKVVSHVQEGKLDMNVVKSTSNKSLNELKDILNEMINTINKNVNSDINPILSQLEEYAKLDFQNKISNPDGNISRGLNNLCEIITNMLKENKENGLALDKSSKILLENVDILNKSSNDTAVSLEETSAALEEITSTVVNNTNRITEMSEHSKELSTSINKGQELANSTVIAMDEINEQTQAIAEAITVIDQIAFQTNILSLNAAVEAATAGEAGKGFAVVAQEVRNLASRSAEAAKEIKDLVENATSKTNNGKQIADAMISGYEKLNKNISKTTEAINDIKEASNEQKTGIQQINDVINKLDQQSQNNASVASQTHEIAENTSTIAQTILDEVNQKKFNE